MHHTPPNPRLSCAISLVSLSIGRKGNLQLASENHILEETQFDVLQLQYICFCCIVRLARPWFRYFNGQEVFVYLHVSFFRLIFPPYEFLFGIWLNLNFEQQLRPWFVFTCLQWSSLVPRRRRASEAWQPKPWTKAQQMHSDRTHRLIGWRFRAVQNISKLISEGHLLEGVVVTADWMYSSQFRQFFAWAKWIADVREWLRKPILHKVAWELVQDLPWQSSFCGMNAKNL